MLGDGEVGTTAVSELGFDWGEKRVTEEGEPEKKKSERWIGRDNEPFDPHTIRSRPYTNAPSLVASGVVLSTAATEPVGEAET